MKSGGGGGGEGKKLENAWSEKQADTLESVGETIYT